MNLQKKIDKVWTVFSKFIRLRDAVDGYCPCISCGRSHHWKECDAGHFISRKHHNTLFNEENTNAQCIECNRHKDGNEVGYKVGLMIKHDLGTIEELTRLGYMTKKYTEEELNELYKHYVNKVKVLEKEL